MPILKLSSISDTVQIGSSVIINSNYREFGQGCFSQDFFQSNWTPGGFSDLRKFIYSYIPDNGEYVSLERSLQNGCSWKDSIQFFTIGSSARTNNASLFVSQLAGNDNNSGNYNSPLSTIQKAIERSIEGDTIFVSSGRYPTTIIDKSLYIIGLDTNVYLDGFDTIRPLQIINIGGDHIFKNLKIVNGKPDCSGDNYNGGAMSTWYSDSILFENCYFSNHVSTVCLLYTSDAADE